MISGFNPSEYLQLSMFGLRVTQRLISPIIVLLLSVPCFSVQNTMPAGRVFDTVECSANKDFSYCLYLPSSYTDTRKWPVIFFFDPAARGRLPVRKYSELAEKYGFVFAASNNTRNGMFWKDVYRAAEIMIKDVHDKFQIDTTLQLASGFSGGSRVASQVVLRYRLSGAIACGAGFAAIHLLPDNLPPFLYAGIVGMKDMNYFEMYEVEDFLKSRRVPVAIFSSEFGHDWPPREIYRMALLWILMQSDRPLHQGRETCNEQLLNEYLGVAEEQTQKLNTLAKVRNYDHILNYFPECSRYRNISFTRDSILFSKQYGKNQAEWNRIRKNELAEQQRLMQSFDRLLFSEYLTDSVKTWWISKVKQLNRQLKSRNEQRSFMAARLLNLITSSCYAYGADLENTAGHEKRILLYRIWTQGDPENKFAWYYLANAYAGNLEHEKAYSALERAIELGFDQLESIKNNPDFQPVLHRIK